jgi:hypothetical protein
MSTFALLQTGTGGTTAAAKTQIGNDITLPAGGPWTVFGVWGQVVKITTVPNEGAGGQLIVDSKSGDIEPDPAPGIYPLIGPCVSESANSAIAAVPLNIWPVQWQASGKAVVSLYYRNQLAITTGSKTAAGIIFGNEIPEVRPLVFCDGVYTSWAAATETSVGTITLAEKATRIVGILADLNKGDAATAGEAILATIRLASDDVKLPPAQYPCCRAFNASDGTAVGQSATPQAQFIPVDIPVEGGARINVYVTSTASVTGNADINVYLAYE